MKEKLSSPRPLTFQAIREKWHLTVVCSRQIVHRELINTSTIIPIHLPKNLYRNPFKKMYMPSIKKKGNDCRWSVHPYPKHFVKNCPIYTSKCIHPEETLTPCILDLFATNFLQNLKELAKIQCKTKLTRVTADSCFKRQAILYTTKHVTNWTGSQRKIESGFFFFDTNCNLLVFRIRPKVVWRDRYCSRLITCKESSMCWKWTLRNKEEDNVTVHRWKRLVTNFSWRFLGAILECNGWSFPGWFCSACDLVNLR